MRTLSYHEAVRAFELGQTVAICTPLGVIMYGHEQINLEMDAQMAFDWAERRKVPMVIVDDTQVVNLPESIPVEALGLPIAANHNAMKQ